MGCSRVDMTPEGTDSRVRDGKAFLVFFLGRFEFHSGDSGYQPRVSFGGFPLHLNFWGCERLSPLRDSKTREGECFVLSKTTIKVLQSLFGVIAEVTCTGITFRPPKNSLGRYQECLQGRRQRSAITRRDKIAIAWRILDV